MNIRKSVIRVVSRLGTLWGRVHFDEAVPTIAGYLLPNNTPRSVSENTPLPSEV